MMIVNLKRILFLLSIVLLTTSKIFAEETLTKILEEARRFERQTGSQVGLQVEVIKSGKVIVNHRGDSPMIPASNLKLVTSAVALDLLGPEYRFSTDFLGTKVKDGVITGLIVRASGDPSYRKPFYRDALQPFRQVAYQLKQQGVHTIRNLMIDDSIFDEEFRGKGWHQRYLLDAYAAPTGSFSLNDNLVNIVIAGNKVSFDPPSSEMQVDKAWRTGGFRPSISRSGDSNTVLLTGTTDGLSHTTRRLTVGNPVSFSGGALWHCFKNEGLNLENNVYYGRSLEQAGVVEGGGLINYCRVVSPTLFRLLEAVNQKSDNVVANHLFKKLGAEVSGVGTQGTSEKVVKDFFARHHIASEGFVQVDGSGLSELNKIKPSQLTGLLSTMYRHRWKDYYQASLASPGVGTLKSRLKGVHVQAKTGTLNNVSGLSGYVLTSYGQTLSFSILVNNVPSTSSARALQDRIVKGLALCSGEL